MSFFFRPVESVRDGLKLDITTIHAVRSFGPASTAHGRGGELPRYVGESLATVVCRSDIRLGCRFKVEWKPDGREAACCGECGSRTTEGGLMAGSYMGEFLYARDHVVDELHAQGKGDSEIAQTLSMSEDQVLLIRTRSREDDPDL